VIAPPGTPTDAHAWALAALARVRGPDLAEPRPAALTRWTGLAALEVRPTWPTAVQVAVPADRAPGSSRRLEVVRSRTYDAQSTTRVGGLTVLEAPALVRSLATVTELAALTDIVIDVVQRRRATLDEIAAEHDRWPHYPGRSRLGEVLARLGAAGRTDSGLELAIRRWLVAEGVPLDRGQVAVPCVDGVSIHLDLGIGRICFGIEAVSMLAHSERGQLRTDARRSNQLARIEDDWRVLAATWEDLEDRDFLALVRDVVGAQSQRHLGTPWPTSSPVIV
jgi:hypothetical protein